MRLLKITLFFSFLFSLSNFAYSQNTEGKTEVVSFIDEDPIFPGGLGSLNQFLMKNLRYPETAIENGLQGKCIIGVIINSDGSLSDITVIKGVSGCPECDREAIRIVKLMPHWIPGKKDGIAVSSRYQLPISFKLN